MLGECVRCKVKEDSLLGVLLPGYAATRLVGEKVVVDWVPVVFRELRVRVIIVC
jgi:hypothetical protein